MKSDMPEKHIHNKEKILFNIENILDTLEIEIDFLEELPHGFFKYQNNVNYNESICKYWKDINNLKTQLETCKCELEKQ